MTFTDVYGARKAAEAVEDTWGHFGAAPGKHDGWILFTHGTYGDLTVIDVDFGDAAGYGPWFYEGIHSWLCYQDTKPGKVYRFKGWYRACKNGAHQFVGKVREAPL